MGIRHLETFICNEVPNGYFEINLEKEIRKSQTPLLVIDLMSFYSLFNKSIQDILCGGRFTLVEEQADYIFSKLVSFGAKLVFFLDGPVQSAKHETWISRQDNKYENIINILRDIELGWPLATVADKYSNWYPQITTYSIKTSAKKYGELYLSIEEEADLELAAFATKNNALAILTNDSDFLIFEGAWRYWSVKDINMDSMNSMEYNRNEFISKVGLSYEQLKLFATIGGNDILRYDDVRNFHRKLGGHPKEKFMRIADFVKRFDRNLTQNDITEILREMFGYRYHVEIEYCFLKSLKSYDINYTPTMMEHADSVLKVLFQEDVSFGYQMLGKFTITIVPFFFDYSKNDMGNFVELIKTLVTKQAGIVLYHRQHLINSVNILIKLTHKGTYEFVTWPANFPTDISVPPIQDIFSKDEEIAKSLFNTKLQLLCWMVLEKLQADFIRNMDVRYVAIVLAIYRLVEFGGLTKNEGDLLLLTAYHVTNRKPLKNLKHPINLTSRGIRSAFLFQRFHNHVTRCTKIVGLSNDFRPTLAFDGVFYQNLLESFNKSNITQKEQLLAEVRNIKKIISNKQ